MDNHRQVPKMNVTCKYRKRNKMINYNVIWQREFFSTLKLQRQLSICDWARPQPLVPISFSSPLHWRHDQRDGVYSTVCSGADQGKYHSSASLAFLRGVHRWPVNSPHRGPVTRKMFPFDDVIMHRVGYCSAINRKWALIITVFTNQLHCMVNNNVLLYKFN